VYVSRNGKTPKEFEHWDSEDGTYYTEGFEFYYILTTVTPNGRTSEKFVVGEKDEEDYIFGGHRKWDYKLSERAGFVRKWKELHRDEQDTSEGMHVSKVRIIEPLPDYCAEMN